MPLYGNLLFLVIESPTTKISDFSFFLENTKLSSFPHTKIFWKSIELPKIYLLWGASSFKQKYMYRPRGFCLSQTVSNIFKLKVWRNCLASFSNLLCGIFVEKVPWTIRKNVGLVIFLGKTLKIYGNQVAS